MLGLAALAALLAMAFVGASSAMAETTQLCTNDSETSCTAVTSVHETSVGKAKLLASPRVECNVLFSSTSVGGAAAPQVIEGHFTYTNCGCTVRERAGTTATIEVLGTSHETASVVGEALIEVNCFGIVCTYKGEELEGTATGPLLSTEANGEVNLSEQEVRGSGSFCPTRGKLDIKTTPLAATYITGGLHYCVDTEHQHGFFRDEECRIRAATRTERYELVIGPRGFGVGAIVCYKQLELPHNGLWRRVNTTTGRCEEDDPNNRQLYEKGEIVKVQ